MRSLVELLLTEEDLNQQYQIYCDMDGVLTDFEARFYQILKKVGKKYYSKEELEGITRPKHFEKKFGQGEFWKLIDEQGEDFWAGMEWMPNGQALWDFISPYNPNILSSPSKDNSSRLGKRMWIRQNLSPAPKEIIFKKAEDKQQYAAPNHILIDDKPSNISEWKAKGGIALEVKDGNIEPVTKALKELGYGTRQLTKKGV
jgi:hypothetical protein